MSETVGTVHNALKHWIIEEARNKVNQKGAQYYKRVYSGDEESIDIRRRMKRIEYKPDVVLIESKKKDVYFIEISFSEEKRAIIGELALAKAAEADAILFILCSGEGGWKKEEIDTTLSVVGESIGFDEWYTLFLTEDEYNNVELAKKRLRADLDDWI